MQTVYTIYRTREAGRYSRCLHDTLLASLPPAERDNVKIITALVSFHNGLLLAPEDPHKYRYIRVMIDVPKGKLQSDEDKQALLQRTVDACLEYEGKYADDCEVEVKVTEVDESDYMRVRGRKPLA